MLFLTGPTASGKSAVALALAAMTGGEVVCADAFQLYEGLSILTAQPGQGDLAAVRHHLYGSVSPTEEMDAARFAKMAEACIAEIAPIPPAGYRFAELRRSVCLARQIEC